jgi:putative transposase
MWNVIKDLLPAKKSRFGRPRIDQRKALEAIFFIIDSGAQWRYITKEYGSKSAIHRTFMRLVDENVFAKIMDIARELYFASEAEHWDWFATDTSFSKAPLAKLWAGKNPTDRGKNGVKKSILVDRKGAPLLVHVDSANIHDSKLLKPTIKGVHTFCKGIAIIAADSAYDAKELKQMCAKMNIALIASVNKRRDKNRKSYSPNNRWIVEQTFGILHWRRGLKTCWTKMRKSFLAYLQFAAAERLFRMAGV